MVASVPEALMTCVTVSLALTAKRMAKKNCLVKNLEAVEALGAIGIICSDKTGTLTMNRMTVSHMWIDNRFVGVNLNEPIDRLHFYENDKVSKFEIEKCDSWKALVRCARLCSRADFLSDAANMQKDAMKRACTGDASETAILQYSEKVVGDVAKYRASYRKIFEIPFNSTSKFQVSVHEMPEAGDRRLLVMKGAPERILDRCKTILIDGDEIEISDDWRRIFNESYEVLGGMGERVLGFCDKVLDPVEYPANYAFDSEDTSTFPPRNLRVLGFISMIDPPKPNVPQAVALCQNAGIKVNTNLN